MRLQHLIPSGTHVAVYSRFSTEEQRRQSIDDQNNYCLSFLNEEYSKCLKSVDYDQDSGYRTRVGRAAVQCAMALDFRLNVEQARELAINHFNAADMTRRWEEILLQRARA